MGKGEQQAFLLPTPMQLVYARELAVRLHRVRGRDDYGDKVGACSSMSGMTELISNMEDNLATEYVEEGAV